ncbi:MAG TPA: zinc ribbon domain-containing protein [Longimicrobiales bacterium]|nr:zinc ribbon domain-containing protein [Longimicrobiales bacterium]
MSFAPSGVCSRASDCLSARLISGYFPTVMPTYEYRCQKGHDFEVFQRMSEPPVEKCIHCGAAAERKLSAGGGLLFKGSGFYITDYRSDTYKKAAEADKGGSSSSSSSTSSGDSGSGKSSGSTQPDSSKKSSGSE